MIKKSFLIVGAGWYGCHIGLFLKKLGIEFVIYEKNKDIFLGASGFNQYRLHSGFHYPRSSETINEIKKNLKKFQLLYNNYIDYPKNNFYCIAKKKSLIDSLIYEIILKSHNLKFKKVINKKFTNVEGTYSVKEGVIKNNKIIKFYKKKLRKELIFNKKITNLKKLKKKYDYIINCTNNTFDNNLSRDFHYHLTISTVYKKKNKNGSPVTFMDGELPSLYPYADYKNYFTLTHAKYTHIKKFKNFKLLNKYKINLSKKFLAERIKNMENSILYFYPNFKKHFSYISYFLSYKVLPNETSSKRFSFIKKRANVISCSSPKIANIFTFEEYLKKELKLNNEN